MDRVLDTAAACSPTRMAVSTITCCLRPTGPLLPVSVVVLTAQKFQNGRITARGHLATDRAGHAPFSVAKGWVTQATKPKRKRPKWPPSSRNTPVDRRRPPVRSSSSRQPNRPSLDVKGRACPPSSSKLTGALRQRTIIFATAQSGYDALRDAASMPPPHI